VRKKVIPNRNTYNRKQISDLQRCCVKNSKFWRILFGGKCSQELKGLGRVDVLPAKGLAPGTQPGIISPTALYIGRRNVGIKAKAKNLTQWDLPSRGIKTCLSWYWAIRNPDGLRQRIETSKSCFAVNMNAINVAVI
jgi:hypothetical protein